MQSLPGGGWMVGWGGLPNLTEFNAQGQMIYDAQLPRGENSYRVYREPWSGQPSEPPRIARVTRQAPTAVYASWNGATDGRLLAAADGAERVASDGRLDDATSGFETTIPAPAAAFYAVRALSASGKVLGSSKAVAPTGG